MPQTKPLQLYQASHLLNLHILNVLFAQNHYEQDGMIDFFTDKLLNDITFQLSHRISPRKQNSVAILTVGLCVMD